MKIINEKLTGIEQQAFERILQSRMSIKYDASGIEGMVYVKIDSEWVAEELTNAMSSLVKKGWISNTWQSGTSVKYQFPVSIKTRFNQLYREKITPEEFAIEMQKIEDSTMREGGAHVAADELLIKVLRQQGFKKGCDIFEKMGKWYS